MPKVNLVRNCIVIACFSLGCILPAFSADIAWSNATTGSFTNGDRWIGNAAPTNGDNALFTNVVNSTVSWSSYNTTNANAYFNMTNSAIAQITLAITNGTWFLTNSMVVGQNAGSSSLVIQSTGTLVITNSIGTGTLLIGQDGRGTFIATGGTLVVDRIIATNSTPNFSSFTNVSATVKTTGDNFLTNVNLFIGTAAGTEGRWDFLGGTSVVRGLSIGAAGTGIVSVVGNSTIVTNQGSMTVGIGAQGGALLIISNGGLLFSSGTARIGNSTGGTNIVLVSGNGSIWTNTGNIEVGGNNNPASGNQLIISNGGTLFAAGGVNVGRAGNHSNLLIITGPGSILTNYASNFRVGNGSVAAPTLWNTVIITNGGVLAIDGARDSNIGNTAGSTSNDVIVTGAGSIFTARSHFVGSNGTTSGSGSILVEDNGLLSGNLITGFDGSGTISNRGGTYEFVRGVPTITTNTVNSIILTNGTVSFRGTNDVDINQANLSAITFQGNNTFQLNNSTSILFSSYFFGTNNSANFQHLALTDTSRWQATNTVFQSGGILTLSNTTSSLFGITTNASGSMIKMTSSNGFSSTVTFEQSLVVSGIGDGNGVIQNTKATNTISAPITLIGNSTISSASGKLTVDGAITNGGNTLTVGGAGNVTLAAQISGTGGLAINGGGTVTISNSSANTFSGATTVTNSTVRLSKAGALGSTSGITLSASGTLLLDGGAIDRVGNTVGITLDGGAITLNDRSETVGTLTLASNSTITLNLNGSAGDLTFGSGTYTAGTLTIDGWFQANEGGEDKLYFTNDPGTNFLAHVTFTGFAAGARLLPGTSELVPSSVPEPGTIVASILLAILASGRFLFIIRRNR